MKKSQVLVVLIKIRNLTPPVQFGVAPRLGVSLAGGGVCWQPQSALSRLPTYPEPRGLGAFPVHPEARHGGSRSLGACGPRRAT